MAVNILTLLHAIHARGLLDPRNKFLTKQTHQLCQLSTQVVLGAFILKTGRQEFI